VSPVTRAFDHINATAHLQLVEVMPDHYPTLKSRWDVMGGTTMPPSPLVDHYSLETEYVPYEIIENRLTVKRSLKYSTEIEWAKHIPTLAKLIDPQQVWHRSRDVAVAVDALRINEMDNRIQRATEWYDDYHKFGLSDRESYEVGFIIRDETKKALRLNYEWINDYIREHIRSSLGGGGFKWRQALDMTRTEWAQVLDIVKENSETMVTHPDWYVSNVPETGERSRANALQYAQRYTQGKIDRTRVIMFGNYMSLWTVFIPDKASWYTKVLAKVEDVIKPSGECYYPYTEGGLIYKRFSDMHLSKLPYHAYDAKTWDAGVGIILGKWVNCYLAPIGRIPQLPSGESHTSMIGTVGSVCATRKLPGVKIILGDDIAHFGTSTMSAKLLECSPEDTKYKFNLGVSYWHDPLEPRISGFKVTKDRSKDMKAIQTQEFGITKAAFGAKHPATQRALHSGLYLGRFGSGTLLELIQNIPAGEFMSPSELLENIVETKVEDAFLWARERGITEIFA